MILIASQCSWECISGFFPNLKAALVYYQTLTHMDYNYLNLDYWMYFKLILCLIPVKCFVAIVDNDLIPCSACYDWWL